MNISLDSLEEALSIRRQMDTLEQQLGALLGRTISSDSTTGKGHRHMSAATRAKIPAAARARWATVKGRQTPIAHKLPEKKGGLTPAGRRRLSQLMKARWAARRKTTTKKAAPAKKKGALTAAGRRRISELMKARWAARRKASK